MLVSLVLGEAYSVSKKGHKNRDLRLAPEL